MIRFAIVVAFVLGMFAGAMPVSAQSTPTAGTGEPATIYGANGEPIGEVTVTNVVDPFNDYDVVYSPPSRGYRWVKVSVTFKAGNAPLPVNTSGFQVVDSDAFVAYQTYIYRSEQSTTEEPDLSATQVEPGQEASGAIFFLVFGTSTISTIEYSPSYDQDLVVAEFRDASANPGDAFEWTTTDGSVVGQVSVAGVVDPLEDYDPSYAPQRGFRYVGVAISFTNTGTRPVTIDGSRFSIVDHEGFVTSYTSVYRTPEGTQALPDFPYNEVAPGGQASGVVTYQLINGATIKDVIFSPTGDRRIRIAKYERDATYVKPELTVVAVDPACEAVLAWGREITAALAPATPAFELVDSINSGGTVTAEAATAQADSLRAIADAVAALDTPEAAQATEDQFVAIVNALADQMSKIAVGLEAGDQAAVSAAATEFYNQIYGITSGPYADLVVRCPGLESL